MLGSGSELITMKFVRLSVIFALCFCHNTQIRYQAQKNCVSKVQLNLLDFNTNDKVYAGVSVEFSSLLSEADKLLASQLQYGGQAAEASQISGREPKMAYTTFEESEKLGMRLKHNRPTRNVNSQPTPAAASPSNNEKNVDTNKIKSPVFVKESNETQVVLRKNKSNSRIFNENNYEVGEGRTVPLLFMGMFGFIEFVIITGIGFALITPVIGVLLILIKFMMTAGLIMIG